MVNYIFFFFLMELEQLRIRERIDPIRIYALGSLQWKEGRFFDFPRDRPRIYRDSFVNSWQGNNKTDEEEETFRSLSLPNDDRVAVIIRNFSRSLIQDTWTIKTLLPVWKRPVGLVYRWCCLIASHVREGQGRERADPGNTGPHGRHPTPHDSGG